MTEKQMAFKPFLFIIATFILTWGCIFALESTNIFNYQMPFILIVFFDFTKSASPLIITLFLLKKRLSEKGFLVRFIIGERRGIFSYAIVILIFILHFLTFYLFRTEDIILSVSSM